MTTPRYHLPLFYKWINFQYPSIGFFPPLLLINISAVFFILATLSATIFFSSGVNLPSLIRRNSHRKFSTSVFVILGFGTACIITLSLFVYYYTTNVVIKNETGSSSSLKHAGPMLFNKKASPILLPERLHFVSTFSLHRDNGR